MKATLPGWWSKGAVWLWTAAIAMVLGSFWLVVARAPVESVMGPVQKIVYIHVPSAIAASIAFAITFAAGVAYLTTRRWAWDALGAASAEVGLVFATVVMVTGPLWARSAWNTWWTWEPRLTTFFILWILYAAFLIIRGSLRGESRRTITAVMGVIFAVLVPIVYMSVTWWRGSLHPRNVTMTGEMRFVLQFSMLAWLCFYAAALERRLRLEWAAEAAVREEDRAEPDGRLVGEASR
jgi:heme exporter protein C